MSREIKFRAWDGDYMKTRIMDRDMTLDNLMRFGLTPPKDDVFMQYTGLKDKNSTEVYEGDVVKCSSGCPHEVVWMQEVPSTNLGGMPGFYLSGLRDGYAWMGVEEVIGNVYENEELRDA